MTLQQELSGRFDGRRGDRHRHPGGEGVRCRTGQDRAADAIGRTGSSTGSSTSPGSVPGSAPARRHPDALARRRALRTAGTSSCTTGSRSASWWSSTCTSRCSIDPLRSVGQIIAQAPAGRRLRGARESDPGGHSAEVADRARRPAAGRRRPGEVCFEHVRFSYGKGGRPGPRQPRARGRRGRVGRAGRADRCGEDRRWPASSPGSTTSTPDGSCSTARRA